MPDYLPIRRLLFTAIIVLSLALPGAAVAAQRLTIATAGTAGALYPMGVALARTITTSVEGMEAAAEASAASLENLRNLSQGQVDWGISQNEVAFLAYSGKDKWEGRPVKNLRSLFGTLISWVQVFAPADSPLKSVADFKGKRVGVGAPGSGGEQAARKVLAFYGLDYKSMKPEFISDAEMVSALKDGTLDAFISTHPLKSAALMDLTTSMEVKLIPVADAGFYERHPYFAKREVPAGTYRGIDEPVATPTSRIVMYTTADTALGEEGVYKALAAAWDHADQWTQTHPAVARYTKLDLALEGLRVPLHPGAARFYREKGMTIPAHLLGQ